MGELWALLGGVRIEVDGRPVQIKGRRPLAIMVLLMLRAGREVSFDTVIDELWPEDPPATARNSVQRFVADIRRALGPHRDRLRTVGDGYRLDDVAVDVHELPGQLRAAVDGDPGDAHVRFAMMEQIIDRMSLELAPGVELASLPSERRRLRARKIEAMGRAAQYAATHGLQVTASLEQWQLDEPLDERLAAAVMSSIAAAGRQADAFALARSLRSALLEDLGVTPSPAFEAAELAVLDQTVAALQPRRAVSASPDAPTPVPAPRRSEPDRQAAPRALSTLIGRDELFGQLAAAVGSERIVTLCGPGGAGKTALASALVADVHPDASVVLLVDLNSDRMVLEAVAAALGMVVDIDDLLVLRDGVARRLSASPVLTVLDNAEHVTDVVADLLARMAAVPGAGRVLITSRERLRLPGERSIEVPPLSLEESSDDRGASPAVRLFARRATGVSGIPEDSLRADPDVAAICRALDGLPLGLELAAARLAMLSPGQLRERMDQPLRAAGEHRGAGRQRSLTALLEWSWDLLDPAEQDLLGLLSQFRGWPLRAVEFLVPDDGLDLLEGLIAKSLVQREQLTAGPRFQMLELVRAFCHDRLDPVVVARARRRHAEWVLDAARRWSEAESQSVAAAHDALDGELANLLLALDWFEELGCRRDHLDLVARASGLFMHRGPVMEGAARSRTAETLLDKPCPVHGHRHDELVDVDRRGFFYTTFAGTALAAGDTSTSFRTRIAASEIVGARPFDWVVDALGVLGVGYEMGRPDGSGQSLVEQSEVLAPASPSASLNRAHALSCRAQVELMQRDYRAAVESFDAAVRADNRPGRVLLQCETGRLGALHLAGEHAEAARASDALWSDPATDSWHYLLEVLRAIALGPTDPQRAADVLDTVLGRDTAAELPGRTGDITIASGVLARLVGRHEDGMELLRSSMGRLPVMSALQAEYLLEEPGRPLDPLEWAEHWEATIIAAYQAQLRQPDGWVQEQILPALVRAQLDTLRTSAGEDPA